MTQLNLHVQSIFGNNWTVWVVEDIYSTFDTNDGAKYNSQFNTLNKNYALKPGEMLSWYGVLDGLHSLGSTEKELLSVWFLGTYWDLIVVWFTTFT